MDVNRWFAANNSSSDINNTRLISCRQWELYGIIFVWCRKVSFDLQALTKYVLVQTWSQSCRSLHSVKALASPKLSKRATPKAPRLCTYIKSSIDNERRNRSKPMRAVYNTPHEAFPLLCSWQLLFELPDSYTVKTKAYSYAYMYLRLPNLCPLRLSVWVKTIQRYIFFREHKSKL